jgi:hypothetical protein
MSYNIFNKNASFQGTTKTADGDIVSGTIEFMVDTHSDQTVNGQKTFSDLSASSISVDTVVSHTGDSDTKISMTTDNISLQAGSSQMLTAYGNLSPKRVQVNNSNFVVDSAYAVGIGVSVPSFKLEVAGDISGSSTFFAAGSASFGNDVSITGSYYGDGSQLTGIGTATSMLASGLIGAVRGTQISSSNGLGTDGANLIVNLSASSGLASETGGLKIDLTDLSTTTYVDGDFILISASAGNRKMALSTLEGGFDSLAAGQVTSGRFNTARMPLTLETQIISASLSISGALFQGDGSLLTGVTSTPAPAGANTQLQFNDDAAFAGDADLTFLTGSNTLATSNVSASVNLSGSSLWLQDEIYVGGQAFLNIESNVVANNASFTEITASSEISSSADVYGANFRGNGSTLTGLPVQTYSNYTANRLLAAGGSSNAITALSALTYNNPVFSFVGNISASINISGSGLYFADSLNLGSTTLIDANANANLGQLTCYVDSKGSTSLPTNNSNATFYVDEGADKFFVYVKYSDGSTKSGSIDLT